MQTVTSQKDSDDTLSSQFIWSSRALQPNGPAFIRCFLFDNVTQWDKHLLKLGMSIRATVNMSTGFKPNMLLLGRKVCMPEEILFRLPNVKTLRQIPSIYLKDLIEKLWVAFIAARDYLRMAQCRQKKNYETRAPIRERKFDVGDLVYTRNLGTTVGQSRKLFPQWKGPFVVTEVISPLLFRVVGRKRGM